MNLGLVEQEPQVPELVVWYVEDLATDLNLCTKVKGVYRYLFLWFLLVSTIDHSLDPGTLSKGKLGLRKDLLASSDDNRRKEDVVLSSVTVRQIITLIGCPRFSSDIGRIWNP